MKCYDCPRNCGANREIGETGYCGGGKYARISKIIDDFTLEEPCLGKTLTAVFFGGCSLRCSYCQNHVISRGGSGEEFDDARLARLISTAKNDLDLVTPTHYLSAIERAADMCGKKKRIIYNTSGYETREAVERAAAFTDVFLADFKYGDAELAAKYSKAPDYPMIALKAIKKMRETRDEWEGETLKRGLVVRHLVLPGHVQNSITVLDTIADSLGTDTVISLMSQFTPNGVGEPNRPLKKIEYKLVAEHAVKLGFGKGYLQDFDSVGEKYTPEF